MSQKKPRNKRYRPTPQPSLPIMFAVPHSDMISLALMPHACLVAIVDGSADESSIYTLANVCNMAALLAQRKRMASLPVAIAGQESIIRVIHRFDTTGKIGFSGSDYQAIKAAVTLNDELQQLCTRRELRDVILILQRSA